MINRVMSVIALYGRHVLILGLVAGALLPDLAIALRPWIGPLIALLLFLAALRIGPRMAVGALRDVGRALGLTAIMQLALPLAAIGLFALVDMRMSAVATFFILMFAASPISGSPSLTVMCGGDPAPALRQLVVGTALLPLTVLPVFWLTPGFGDPGAVVSAVGGLMALIAIAGGGAFLLRATVMKEPKPAALQAIDAVSVIVLAVVVIGLMSAVGPAMFETPLTFVGVLLLVCAVNFAVQVVAALVERATGSPSAIATGIVAGNRNIALFLSVLPQSTVDPILLLIGCYQIPMYLTPAVLGRFYARVAGIHKG
ncbi:MAG: hypothetical protein WBF87_08645 [Mesorhizobium sp.]